ncbi:MAG: carbon storage regulator CsrA [Nitrospiraceae bacterium]|nr:carbon storage regulator CsrA [Nitrospiraceae bacterium]MDA8326983.1 carbon storage regulator CsrA [Nitrospiraceae bacterium]
MLALTRKSKEAIRIGGDITVTVVEIKGGQVRLGIEAPPGVRIYRAEVYEKILRENMMSSDLSVDEFGKIKEALGQKHEDKV